MLYTHDEVRKMSMFRKITILSDRVDMNTCDGECDQLTPFIKCEGCHAASALNNISEVIADVLTNNQ